VTGRLALLRLGAKYAYAWRGDVALAWISSALVMLAAVGTWHAAARAGGEDPRIAATWVVLAWAVSRVTTSRLDDNLAQRWRSGQVATDLLKPMGLVSWLLWRDAGRALATALVIGAPLVLLGAALGPLALHGGVVAAVGFLTSLGLGVITGGALAICVGVLAARSGQGQGIVGLKEVVVPLISGALVPHAMLPDGVARALSWLPTAGLATGPAAWWMGGPRPFAALAIQAVWAVALCALAELSWRRATRALTVVGG
jgi:ABC-2 type transport system permease protein